MKLKTFSITWMYSVREETIVEAKNEKEAIKKFRTIHPDDRVLDTYELRRNPAMEG